MMPGMEANMMMPGMSQMPGMMAPPGGMAMPGMMVPPPPTGAPDAPPGMEGMSPMQMPGAGMPMQMPGMPGMPGMMAPGMSPMGMPGMPGMMAPGGMQAPGMMMAPGQMQAQGQMMMMMTPNGPMMGMNPMMMGMNPMMMGMNPMMMGGQMPQGEAVQEQAAAMAADAYEEEAEATAEPAVKQPSLRERLGIGPRDKPARDLVWGKNEHFPEVKELCSKFQIEDRIRDRLNDVMMTREGSYDKDMKALWEVCENAKKPSGFLMVKISELERGVFTGAAKSDNDLTVFVQKHRLDDRCLAKMLEVFHNRQETKWQELKDIEKLIRGSDKQPQAVVMPLLESLKRTGRLPSPARSSRKSKKSESRSRSRSRSKSKKRKR